MKKNRKYSTKEWFNRWSNEYDRTLGNISFHKQLLDLVVANSQVKKKERVLDMGCGTGLLSLKFLKKADCKITGIDMADEMLSIFRKKLKAKRAENKVKTKRMNVESLDFPDNSFDLAVSSVTLHHIKDKLKTLKKIYKVIRPGGKLIIGEIDMDTTGSHLDVNRLKRILKVLEQEWVPALKDVGLGAFEKMYDNGKKHILNQGEYCLSLKQWSSICRRAGFSKVSIKRVKAQKCFGIVLSKK